MDESPCGIADVIYIYRFGTCHDMQMPYVFRIVGVRFIEPAFAYYTQALVDLRAAIHGAPTGTCGRNPVSCMNFHAALQT